MTNTEMTTSVAYSDLVKGEYYFFGQPLFEHLIWEKDLVEIIALSTGKNTLTEEEKKFLNALAMITAPPDPRIWPLKAARILASYGCFFAGLATANLCLGEARIGFHVLGEAAQLLKEVNCVAQHTSDNQVEEKIYKLIKTKKHLAGFGVPLRETDERIDALRLAAEQLGKRNRLTYWRTFELLWHILGKTKGLSPNIALPTSAALLDLGFQVKDIPVFCTTTAQYVFAAHAHEGAQKASPLLQRFPDTLIQYEGKELQQSPRSRNAD
ncbi:MAG: hypothetical protein IPJ88_07315 [Myxococcales bacterium]|nr:MAG: hypothetical protein IPJ88_07315 [Myxococcales bacterium]